MGQHFVVARRAARAGKWAVVENLFYYLANWASHDGREDLANVLKDASPDRLEGARERTQEAENSSLDLPKEGI